MLSLYLIIDFKSLLQKYLFSFIFNPITCTEWPNILYVLSRSFPHFCYRYIPLYLGGKMVLAALMATQWPLSLNMYMEVGQGQSCFWHSVEPSKIRIVSARTTCICTSFSKFKRINWGSRSGKTMSSSNSHFRRAKPYLSLSSTPQHHRRLNYLIMKDSVTGWCC